MEEDTKVSNSSSSTSINLHITESDISIENDDIPVKQQNKRKNKKRKENGTKPRLTNKPTVIYTTQEINEAVNLLNAKDTFFDDPHKFEELYCIQNIYKYDNPSIKSLDSLARLFQEAIACFEKRDWKHFVLIIIKALQFPNITRTLVKHLILMEVLYDPAIKNSDISRQCMSIMFGENVQYNDLIANLSRIPETMEKKFVYCDSENSYDDET